IIRVDRVQPAEVKARHILIAPVIDSNDVHLAYLRADSVANMWRKGANFDTLVAKYHDPAEEKGILQPYPVDSLPASYKAAVADLKVNDVSAPFALVSQSGSTKYAIIQVVAKTAEGEYSLSEVRENIRRQLAEEKQARALLDELRKQTYVSLRL
ncbi:MAG TPA: peptidylprolyl isomerase, partial [Gemmatimonadaceae bacterium]|nr:peptidylprolyl isomerase [Gemmatimonadaceae bacterium]